MNSEETIINEEEKKIIEKCDQCSRDIRREITLGNTKKKFCSEWCSVQYVVSGQAFEESA
ncbi:MAG: hypothetical protein COB02_16320 [Candidatus Cloacimonadota bacterium]|nr:MAG: hypothetical protein COB02_16320 [Candidatus Cloacimonadota bacterium]